MPKARMVTKVKRPIEVSKAAEVSKTADLLRRRELKDLIHFQSNVRYCKEKLTFTQELLD